MSDRQHKLFAVLGVLLVGTGYALARGVPRWRERNSLREAMEEMRQELGALPEGTVQTDAARGRVGAARARVAKLSEELETQRPFAPSSARRDLALVISKLAEETGLWLESREAKRRPGGRARSSPSTGAVFAEGPALAPAKIEEVERPEGEPTHANLAQFLAAPPCSCAVEEWTARGSFPALRAFLAGLDQLPQRITVLRLAVQRPPGTVEDDDPPLRIQMTIAL